MSTQVEARSLASLNYLAANPPQYPHKPAEQRQDPLTLYISRVPGTRDVILTTSKPHLKNVTSEDVANSFYYIHLELPSDGGHPYNPNLAHAAASQPHHLRNPDTPRSSQDSARSTNQIRRKPLPTGAKVPSPPADPPRSQLPPALPPAPAPLTRPPQEMAATDTAPATRPAPTRANPAGPRTARSFPRGQPPTPHQRRPANP
ncbi:oxidoreductase-like protein [Colletotrichum tofieldiae]|nr:oxidoreductase-like protein [Colletotrichum tofieldiae]